MIEQRSLAQILDAAFRVVRERAGLLIGIGFAYGSFVPIVFEVLLPTTDATTDFETTLIGFVCGVFEVLGYYAIAFALLRVANREHAKLGASLTAPWRSQTALFVYAGLLSLFQYAFLGLTWLPGPPYLKWILIPALLFVWFSLWSRVLCVPAVLAVERSTTLSAVGRAWRLTTRHHWRAFGLVLLLSVVALPFEAPSMIAILFTPTWSSGVAIAQHLFDSLLTAFSGAAVFYFYIDLRVRTESLDLEFLAARVERAAEPRLAVDEGNGLL